MRKCLLVLAGSLPLAVLFASCSPQPAAPPPVAAPQAETRPASPAAPVPSAANPTLDQIASAQPGGAGDNGHRQRDSAAGGRRERPSATPQVGPEALAQAFRDQAHGRLVEFSGTVEKVLRDDLKGSQHERFLVRVGDQSILIAYNTDLAPRVPVVAGSAIDVRGRYEWNKRGGVVHWTHRDPRGRGPAGWIRLGGKTYQ